MMKNAMTLVSRDDPQLRATLTGLVRLTLVGGASVADDHPGHVRAASALRRWGTRLVMVQDDVNALSLRDAAGQVRPLLLPAGKGGRRVFGDERGNKHDKMDLEACVILPDGRLVAFGSGSTAARETLVVVTPGEPPRLVDGTALYAHLRAEPAFAGSELNIEGALVAGDVLVLLQRGNGAARGDRMPVNAIGRLDLAVFLRWLDHGETAPELVGITRLELGALHGIALGITDASLTHDGRIALIACAEASPDVTRDGRVVGCRFGLIEGDGLRMTDVLDGEGRLAAVKLEGIEHRPIEHRPIEHRAGRALVFDVVADMDRPAEPACLGRLDVIEG